MRTMGAKLDKTRGKRSSRRAASTLVALLTVAHLETGADSRVNAAMPQVDQRALASDLGSPDMSTRQKALATIAKIPPAQREHLVMEAIDRKSVV